MEKNTRKKRQFLKKIKKKEVYNMRLVSQKRLDAIFIGGLVGMVGLSALTMFTAFSQTMTPSQEPAKTKVVAKQSLEIDNRLEQFLDSYISTYFNRSTDSQKQEERNKQLETFYNFTPEVKASNEETVDSTLISAKLQRVINKVAIYKVSYEVGAEKTKVTVLFGIPFGGDNGKYYVAGLPYFQAVTSLKADDFANEKDRLSLNATDDLSEPEREKLKKFLDLFFTNYTTSQENLNVMAKDLTSINGVSFRAVDYTYFKIDNKRVTAYVQVSFDIAGAQYSENFTLSMVEKDETYYVEKMEHVIPSDYWR